jgi:exosortase
VLGGAARSERRPRVAITGRTATTSLRVVAPSLLLAAAAAAFLAPALAHAVGLWSTTEEFSYGFLILPTSAALIFLRRRELARLDRTPDARGLLVAGAAVAVYVIAERASINALAGLAVTPLLFGGALYLWGRRVALVLAFPFAFLAFGLAGHRGLLDSLGFALQVATADGTGVLSRWLGLPVTVDGLVLQLPSFAFVVAEACSGMSSLLSLLALSSLLIYFAEASVPRKLIVIASVLPLVLVANVLRVTLVLAVANAFGPDAALGFFHGASSLVLFGVALVGLIVISRIVGCRIRVAR